MRLSLDRAQSAGIVLPYPFRAPAEAIMRALMEADDAPFLDFKEPAGEAALLAPDSVSWRVFKNPVSVFIGGVAAVILELGEPRVRSGVWEHTRFRADPVRRLRRTGLAAMVTVYGGRSAAERMIAGVRRRHERIAGTTPCGQRYRASDPELLAWVHATAAFGFVEAYGAYVRPLSATDRDRYYAEGREAARLYGVERPPATQAELEALFRQLSGKLEPSPILHDFLEIMRRAPVLPSPLRPLQRLMITAAIAMTPPWAKRRLGLEASEPALRLWEAALVRRMAGLADRIVLEASPAVQASRRLGLPADYLFRGPY
jgi:uncharacterized protein (DUF2236 family)